MGLLRKKDPDKWSDYIQKAHYIHVEAYQLFKIWQLSTNELISNGEISVEYQRHVLSSIEIGNFLLWHQSALEVLKEGTHVCGRPKFSSRGLDLYSIATINQQCLSEILLNLFYTQVTYIGAAMYCLEDEISVYDFEPANQSARDVRLLSTAIDEELMQFDKIFHQGLYTEKNLALEAMLNATNREIVFHAEQMVTIPIGMAKSNLKRERDCAGLLGWIAGVSNEYHLNSFFDRFTSD